VSGGSSKSRKKRQDVAGTLASRTSAGGGLGTDFDLDGGLIASTGNRAHCLNAGGMGRQDYETETMVVSFAQNSRNEVRLNGSDGSKTGAIAGSVGVRRLTPRECERLQGFPDDYTLVTHRKKPACDGPRYKAIGNSMAVPVIRWICQRIQEND